MARLIAPFAPFIAETIWQELNQSSSVHAQTWPTFEPNLIIDDTMTIVIQINGKLKDKCELPKDTPEHTAIDQAKSQEKIIHHLSNKKIIKTIFVPNRLINFVVK